MVNNTRIFLGLLFSIYVLITINSKSYGDVPDAQLTQMVASIQGLGEVEIAMLSHSLLANFKQIQHRDAIDAAILESIKSVVSAGVFEEASYDKIADIALKVYVAESKGAPHEYVEDLALIGFSHSISADQLEYAAKSLNNLIANQIDPVVIEEIVAYGLYNDWSGSAIAAISDGIIRGQEKNLNIPKLVLALIISVDQNTEKQDINLIVDENIRYIEKIESHPHIEPESKKIAYDYFQKSISNSIPRQIAQELYFIALRDNWSVELISAIFDGMISGYKLGLSPEKLATSIIVRVAQGTTGDSPTKLIENEINYVKQLEQRKIELLQKDQKKYNRDEEPQKQRDDSYISTGSRQTPTDDQYYQQIDRNQLNYELLKQRIEEFLGPPATPYRWGGTSVQGADCSGFVQAVYLSQGIYLPRTSRNQVNVGYPISINELKFGDLLFFSKYFNNFITHVGIYIGNGRFVHSSSSRGVVISSLSKSYYRIRYRVAKRIIG